MTNSMVNVFYIGTRPILDTVQGSNGVMEGANSLLGHYAVGTDAVYHDLVVQHDPAVVDGLLATNDYGAGPLYPDGYYDEGFSNTVSGGFSELDSQQLFLGTVTYRDIDGTVKTMENVPFNVYQLENGDTYIAPTTEITSPTSGLASDGGQFIASVLSGRDILSVDLNTLRSDPIGHDNLIYDYESVQDQVQTFYLGNKAILDTTQGNGTMESAGTLLGGYNATAGTPGAGEFTLHMLNIHHDPAVNDAYLATNDYGASAYYPDGYYDEGFSNAPTAGQNGTSFSELDSQQLFWGDVYYIDAAGNEQVMHNVALNVYQLENGDVFAVPTREILSGNGTYSDADDTTASVLAGLRISRIELTSLRPDAIGHDSLMYDSESISNGTNGAIIPDGVVDGSGSGDAMGPGYVDAQGDRIDGTNSKDDVIFGYGGNDTVDAGLGNDIVDAGDGNDLVQAGDGNDLVLGGLGDDTLSGGVGADTLNGDDGNDSLNGDDGNDSLLGGAGNDTILGGSGNDTIDAGLGNDIVDAGDGNDWVVAGDGNDRVLGGLGNDILAGGADDDTLLGEAGDDSLIGNTGNDSIDAGVGNDTLDGGDGNDWLLAGDGNDTLDGGADNDTLLAGAGDDNIFGGSGNDSIVGSEGNDTVDGGDGDDYINTRTSPGLGAPDIGLVHPTDPTLSYSGDTDPNNDKDRVLGGAGNDTILTGDDDDTVLGGTGNDVVDAGFDDDVVYGDDGNDSVQGNEGADLVFGGAGNDVIYGGLSPLDPAYASASGYELTDDIDPSRLNNADVLYGGDGDDRIYGQDDADKLDGGIGNDTLDGGIDDDSLDGGDGNDSLLGGSGADTLKGGLGNDSLDMGGDDNFVDTVVFSNGEGNDLITGFEAPTDNGDGTYTVGDRFDVSKLTDADGNPVNAADVVVSDDGNGNAVLTFPNGETVTLIGVAPERIDSYRELTAAGIPCFAAGTQIETINGPKPIEELTVGDLVETADHGFQPIRWIGSRELCELELLENRNLRPIRIRAGALGAGLPERDLLVSPQHRILVQSRIAMRMFGKFEILVAAKQLVLLDGVDIVEDAKSVTYFHMLFDQHQIVYADGAMAESLYIGPEALLTVGKEAILEILRILPGLRVLDTDNLPQPARPLVRGRFARRFAYRHLQNNLPVCSPITAMEASKQRTSA